MGVLGTDFAQPAGGDFTPGFDTTSDDAVLTLAYVYNKLTTDRLIDSEAAGAVETDPDTWWTDFGDDVGKYWGMTATPDQAAGLGPKLAIMLERDPNGPVTTADVTVTVNTVAGLLSLVLAVKVTGPSGRTFSWVLAVPPPPGLVTVLSQG
jgi:hypothetical protein